MIKRYWHVGVIIGALLTAMVIVALPRSAAASGWRSGFVHPYRSFISSHRFGDFNHRFVRNRLQIRRIHGQRFHCTGPGYAFHHVKQVRDPYGYVRQGLGHGSTLIMFRR